MSTLLAITIVFVTFYRPIKRIMVLLFALYAMCVVDVRDVINVRKKRRSGDNSLLLAVNSEAIFLDTISLHITILPALTYTRRMLPSPLPTTLFPEYE